MLFDSGKIFTCFLVISIILLNTFCPTNSSAREISKAGNVYEQVKSGVVTIFTSAGHGSGFIVDNSGLIMTNSHVVNETGTHLRVKFSPHQIVEGKLIANDWEQDIAIVRVNLGNIKDYKALPFFTPPSNEPLVLIGEQVIAIGSPIERETLEKTMTTGLVGKFDNQTIHHDADINPGNSGGPLLNYDGQVVGINTFIRLAKAGPGISGAVPITRAIAMLEKAKQNLQTVEPSAELLPDIPEIDFPISQFLKDDPSLFPKRKAKAYNFEANYFKVSVLTPPQGFRQTVKIQDLELAKRKKRAQKKGFAINDDEYDYKNLKYYNYNKPLVTFLVIPKPKLTTGSKVFNTFAFVAATGATVASFGAAAPIMVTPFMIGKKEVKKDFYTMELRTEAGKIACTPIETGRIPFQENLAQLTGYTYQDFIDKSYLGLYSYDSKCFETPQKLHLVIDIEGEKDKDYSFKVPDSIKRVVVEDFKPYHDYVAKQQSKPAL